MRIDIRHRHVELPDDLRAAVQDKLDRVARHLPGMERADVAFTEARNPRIADHHACEATLYGHGHIVRAKAGATTQLAALDEVVEKLQHRLERLKGRLARHTPRSQRAPAADRPSVDSSPDRTSAHDVVDDADEGHGKIVRTKQFAMKPMTPEEASLQMELLGHDFFLFTNAETDRAAVVYRRADGYVGLIEST